MRVVRHWPVGLLYDLFTGRDPAANNVEEDDEHLLPWTLIVHFRDYPTKYLMRLEGPATCHDSWMNTVKEVGLTPLVHSSIGWIAESQFQ